MTAPGRRWPRIIGHRGAALAAPENTLAGFCMAAALNVEWVEFDVRLTSDDRCILLHDDTLDRTTNGHGPASRLTFDEVRRLDAGTWFGPDFAGQPVPSLEETIGLLAQLNLGAGVEMKSAPVAEAATGRTAAAVLAERWPAALPPPVLSSVKPAALRLHRQFAAAGAGAVLLGGRFRLQRLPRPRRRRARRRSHLISLIRLIHIAWSDGARRAGGEGW